MAKISKMTVGQTLWSVFKTKMGNTTIRTTVCLPVHIEEIDPEQQWVVASVSNNPSRKYYQRQANAWKVNEPTRPIK